MISVIILTKNQNYEVLEVPQNGILVIKERHLICGMVQNGLQVVPYGTVLSAFEVFLFENTMSVEMVSEHLYMPEGRVLDFTNIELLLAHETKSFAQSGTSELFTPPTYESGGYPVDYRIRLKGLNWTLEQAKSFVDTRTAGFANALTNDSNGYQRLSYYGTQMFEYALFQDTPGLTEIYDIGWGITNMTNYFFDKCPDLKIISLPNLIEWRQQTIFNLPIPSLNLLDIPKATTLGTAPAQLGIFHGKIGNSCHLRIPRVHETNNAGLPHASVKEYIDNNPLGVVEYVD